MFRFFLLLSYLHSASGYRCVANATANFSTFDKYRHEIKGAKARLRESWLPLAAAGEFTQPSLRLLFHVCTVAL